MHRADMIIARPDLFSLTDPATGTRYVLGRQYAGFNLLLPEGNSQISGPYPPFVGWTPIDGIMPIEGPYPQWNLPRVRWGIYPATRLHVQCSQAGDYRLILDMRRSDDPRQAITVSINGQTTITHHFTEAFEFQSLSVEMKLKAGDNTIELRYASGDPDGPPGRAVLFSKMQVIPVEK